jgi:hypothetical protein
MVAGKNLFFTIINKPCLIIYASLKEIRLIVNEEWMPQDLGDRRTYGRVQLCPSSFNRGFIQRHD